MDAMVEGTDKKTSTNETENNESPVIGNTSLKTRKRSMAANETPAIQRRSTRIKLSIDEQQNGTGRTDSGIVRPGSSNHMKVHQGSSDNSSRDKPEEEDKPPKIFGFLGLGNIGMSIANCMLTAGCKLYVWSPLSEESVELKEKGAVVCENPKEVVEKADTTFCCVDDSDSVKRILFGYEGVLKALYPNKVFIDMSLADDKTSKLISEFVVSVGAKFLNVRLQGTISDAKNGSMLLVAAGDRMLFNDCLPYFKTFSKESTFIGDDVGKAAIANIFISSGYAQINDATAETAAFAETLGLNRSDFIEALKVAPEVTCPYELSTINKLNSNDFNNAERTVIHQEKNLALFQGLAAAKNFMSPISASANVNYRYSKKLGHSNYDSIGIFQSIKKY